MNQASSNSFNRLYCVASGTATLLRLRIVEAVVFFVIVFVARDIAGFTYPTLPLLLLFGCGLAMQLFGPLMTTLGERRMGLESDRADSVLITYSSVIDILLAVGIVYLTGTIESPFLFLLVVPLFFVSHLFSRQISVGIFLTGTIASVGLLGYLEHAGLIIHFSCYATPNGMYLNPIYLLGTLLVMGGFLSLVMFLSNTFQDHFHHSMDSLRRQDMESRSRIEDLSRLYDISLGINAVITVETLLKMVAKEATILMGEPWASIILFDQDGEITHSVFVGIPEGNEFVLGSKVRPGGLTQWLIDHEQVLIIEDVKNDRRTKNSELLKASRIGSLIGLPLRNGRQTIGVIYIGDFVKKQFEDRQLRLLTIMGDQMAIAIAKSKLYESIQSKVEVYEKQVSKLEEVNHLKSEFVSHVSHELRTPLTSIKAYIETLEHHIDDPKFTEKKEFLSIVARETERLIRIVGDILDVSNIEFGHRKLQREQFDIGDIITAVISVLQPKIDEKNVTINVELPDGLPKVDADKDLITQAFINLIGNALKYTLDGTAIWIRVEEDAVDLRVSIEDEGIGIPQEQISRIFDKYYRVKSEDSKRYDGVGLGLAIVKNIIDQHGGIINVESREHVGSKFTISIPKEHCVNNLLDYMSQGIEDKSGIYDMLAVIMRMVAELLSAKIISLMLLDPSREELFIKVSYGLDPWIVDQARVKVGEGIAGMVAKTGESLLIADIEENEIYCTPNNPQYETMSLLSVPLKLGNVVVGVINVNNKTSGKSFTEDEMTLLQSFAARIATTLERARESDDSGAHLKQTVDAFAKMIEVQVETRSIEQTIDLSLKLARRLRLPEKDVTVIQYVASVHDIGMTQVSDEILNKTFKLTVDEVEKIHKHPKCGVDLIRPLEFVELVSNIILYHHERVDGRGYPMGLRGDDIPIGSRILAIVDAYQSMTTERPYREQLTPQDAVRELVEYGGKQFDEVIVDHFIAVLADDGKLLSSEAVEMRRLLKDTEKTKQR